MGLYGGRGKRTCVQILLQKFDENLMLHTWEFIKVFKGVLVYFPLNLYNKD